MKSSMSIILIVLAVAIVGLFVVSSGANGSRDLTGNAFILYGANFCFDPDQSYVGSMDMESTLIKSTTKRLRYGNLVEQKTDYCTLLYGEPGVAEYYCTPQGLIARTTIPCSSHQVDDKDTNYVCYNGACIPEDEVPQLEVHPSVPTGNRQVFI